MWRSIASAQFHPQNRFLLARLPDRSGQADSGVATEADFRGISAPHRMASIAASGPGAARYAHCGAAQGFLMTRVGSTIAKASRHAHATFDTATGSLLGLCENDSAPNLI